MRFNNKLPEVHYLSRACREKRFGVCYLSGPQEPKGFNMLQKSFWEDTRKGQSKTEVCWQVCFKPQVKVSSGFKFKNTRLSFTFGHDGLLSIQDNR